MKRICVILLVAMLWTPSLLAKEKMPWDKGNWYEAKSKHYIVKVEKSKEFAEEILFNMEAILEAYSSLFTNLLTKGKAYVIIFNKREDYINML